jgi:high-affinity nickel-transport protein
VGEGISIGLIITALGFGFRHGIDWDHIAALTDLTGSAERPRRSMLLATLYALGHALVVFALGFGAIVLAARLPAGIDGLMERFVGVTLLALGIYVAIALVRQGREFRMRSRWMLLGAGVRRVLRRRTMAPAPIVIEHEHEHAVAEVHEHEEMLVHPGGPAHLHPHAHGHTHSHKHRHIAVMPDDPFPRVGWLTALFIGMLHGIGAETPTQVVIFATAAGVAGKFGGMFLLVCFLAGLLVSNTVVALAGTFGILGATRNFRVYVTISAITAVFSIVTGAIFVLGFAGALPSILGG